MYWVVWAFPQKGKASTAGTDLNSFKRKEPEKGERERERERERKASKFASFGSALRLLVESHDNEFISIDRPPPWKPR